MHTAELEHAHAKNQSVTYIIVLTLQDTAGIHNLHGMPGVLGGIAAGVASIYIKSPHKLGYPHGHHQFLFQIIAILGMLTVAILSGALAGCIARILDPARQSLSADGFFEDSLFWEEVEEEGEGAKVPTAGAGETVAVARG